MEIIIIIAIAWFIWNRYADFVRKAAPKNGQKPSENESMVQQQPIPAMPHAQPQPTWTPTRHTIEHDVAFHDFAGSMPEAHDEVAMHGARPTVRTPVAAPDTQATLLGNIDASALTRSVVMAEVLGKPVSMRKRSH